MASMDTVNRTCPAAAMEHQPRLASLVNGTEGLEISLEDEALPPVLLEVNTLLCSGEHAQARACLNQAALAVIDGYMADNPSRTDIMYITARLLSETGQADKAEALLVTILEKERHPIVWADLARLLEQDPARKREAITHWKQAYKLDPDNPEYLRAYLRGVRHLGDVQACVELLEQAMTLAPDDHAMRRQLLCCMNYLPGYERSDLFAQAKRWAQAYAMRVRPYTSFTNCPSPTKRLRIGIVSGGFINNAPLTFFEPALMAMNRDHFELYGYSYVAAQNVVADRVLELFDVLRDIRECSDHESAAVIREDGIDILVAFEGSSASSRLGVFALKPAPVQIDWGAVCSLGLPQIDHRITDDVLDPPDTQRYHGEELVYLSGGFVTFSPPQESPPVEPLPAQSNGYFTFGSFNGLLKINDLVLDMWAQILQRVPNARMVLKFPEADDPGVRAFILQRFTKRGLDTGRIQMCGLTEYDDHLRLLGQADMLLDCYPFNGFRTTLEGLWMGVPTITMSGTTFTSRAGLAVMKQLGLDAAFVAQTSQAYVDRACAYTEQLDELACIRSALRELLLSSSMCDPVRYARSLEDAFQYMWQQWCAQQGRREEKAV